MNLETLIKKGAETLERWHKEAEAYRHAVGRNDFFYTEQIYMMKYMLIKNL